MQGTTVAREGTAGPSTTRVEAPLEPLSLQLGITAASTAELRWKLELLLVTVELAQKVLTKADTFGEVAALGGVQDLFVALQRTCRG